MRFPQRAQILADEIPSLGALEHAAQDAHLHIDDDRTDALLRPPLAISDKGLSAELRKRGGFEKFSGRLEQLPFLGQTGQAQLQRPAHKVGVGGCLKLLATSLTRRGAKMARARLGDQFLFPCLGLPPVPRAKRNWQSGGSAQPPGRLPKTEDGGSNEVMFAVLAGLALALYLGRKGNVGEAAQAQPEPWRRWAVLSSLALTGLILAASPAAHRNWGILLGAECVLLSAIAPINR